jgi:glycosyltransferase involved in cell wall biosynthesis
MGIPWIQTLHDLTPLAFPHALLRADARRWRSLGGRLAGAAAVVVPSRSTAQQARTYLGLGAEKLHVVPHGVAAAFRAEGSRVTLDVPYLLLVAAWGPHKGFEDAVAALEHVVARGLPHHLVICGPQDAWMQRHIDEIVAGSRHPDRIRCLGFVEDLPALYRGADLLVMPSRAEGFGLPVLEAMACGTPVVSYDNTSLVEVVGDAGLLVADGDVRALGTAMADVLVHPALAEGFRTKGVQRAARYTWQDSVDRHLALLRSATWGSSTASINPTSDQ